MADEQDDLEVLSDGSVTSPIRECEMKMEDVIAEGKEYTNCHRAIIQYMIKVGMATVKQFYISFLHIRASHLNGGSMVKVPIKIDGVSEESLSELTDAVVESCNSKLITVGIHMKRVRRDVDDEEVVVIVSELHFTDALSAAVTYTHDEQVLIFKWMDFMFTEGEGYMTPVKAAEFAHALPRPITGVRAQAMLDFLQHNFFIQKDVANPRRYALGPRGLAEMQPILRNRYRLSNCALCGNTILQTNKAEICPAVEGCGATAHRKCVKKFMDNITGDTVFCPNKGRGCNMVFTREEFLKPCPLPEENDDVNDEEEEEDDDDEPMEDVEYDAHVEALTRELEERAAAEEADVSEPPAKKPFAPSHTTN